MEYAGYVAVKALWAAGTAVAGHLMYQIPKSAGAHTALNQINGVYNETVDASGKIVKGIVEPIFGQAAGNVAEKVGRGLGHIPAAKFATCDANMKVAQTAGAIVERGTAMGLNAAATFVSASATPEQTKTEEKKKAGPSTLATVGKGVSGLGVAAVGYGIATGAAIPSCVSTLTTVAGMAPAVFSLAKKAMSATKAEEKAEATPAPTAKTRRRKRSNSASKAEAVGNVAKEAAAAGAKKQRVITKETAGNAGNPPEAKDANAEAAVEKTKNINQKIDAVTGFVVENMLIPGLAGCAGAHAKLLTINGTYQTTVAMFEKTAKGAFSWAGETVSNFMGKTAANTAHLLYAAPAALSETNLAVAAQAEHYVAKGTGDALGAAWDYTKQKIEGDKKASLENTAWKVVKAVPVVGAGLAAAYAAPVAVAGAVAFDLATKAYAYATTEEKKKESKETATPEKTEAEKELGDWDFAAAEEYFEKEKMEKMEKEKVEASILINPITVEIEQKV